MLTVSLLNLQRYKYLEYQQVLKPNSSNISFVRAQTCTSALSKMKQQIDGHRDQLQGEEQNSSVRATHVCSKPQKKKILLILKQLFQE